MANRICFIGAGKMAEALIKGIIKSGLIKKSNIIASDVSSKRLQYLKRTYKIKISRSNSLAISRSKVIVLSVKPQNMSKVLSEISSSIKKNQLIISIAAGIRLKNIENKLKGIPVIRVMPNNPALIGEGISAISSGKRAKRNHKKLADKIFKSVGETIYVEEKDMDAVTALSGSGPAYVYQFLNDMIAAGKKLGLGKNSEKLSEKTLLGAIRTVITTEKSPEELIKMVASPGGTTIAGLEVLKKKKFGKILNNAIISAAKRSKQLSRQFKT